MRENTVQVLEAAATSGLPVTYTSVTPAICTVINGARQNYINAIAAGSCVIEAAQLGNSSITAANPIQQTLQVLATNDSRVILVIDPNGGSFTVNNITYFSAYGTVVNSGTVFTLPQKSPARTALNNTAYSNVVWTVGDINGAVAPTSFTVTADTIVVAKWS
jgi:hypothetical protein